MPTKTGRPTKPAAPGTRVSLGLKVTADLKNQLELAAEASGRTQSQEAEHRIEQSFAGAGERTLTLGTLRSPQLAGLVALLFVVMKRVIEESSMRSMMPAKASLAAADWHGAAWLRDPYAYDQMVKAAIAALELLRPEGDTTQFANGHQANSEFEQHFGSAAAYNLLRRVKFKNEDEPGDDLLPMLRRDLGSAVEQISLDNDVYSFISRFMAAHQPIAPASALLTAENVQQPAPDRKLIAAAKRLARKKEGQQK